MKLLIPVASGFEQTVKRQLFRLGYEKAPANDGRIEVDGDWLDVARLNLFLRSGERVLIKLAQFPARTFDELFDGVYQVEWEKWLETDSKILMDGKSVASTLGAIKATGGVAKKAIIRRLSDKKRGARQTFCETGARSIIGISILKDIVTLTLDTSGDGLHKRGYRTLSYTAPLKETFASALIDNTFYSPENAENKPFADPFCGSGTLPIEACLKALEIAPGLNRTFDFEKWKIFDSKLLKLAKEEARDKEKRNRKLLIYGSDVNPQAISIAKYHAKQAGVENYIRFSIADMRNFQSQEKYGVLLSNPPYGERLSDIKSVQTLMRDFGKVFRSLPDWSAYILTSLPEFERYFGKNADKRKKLFNANLPCGFYSYLGAKPSKDE